MISRLLELSFPKMPKRKAIKPSKELIEAMVDLVILLYAPALKELG